MASKRTRSLAALVAGDIASSPSGANGADEATAKLLDSVVAANPGNVTVFTAGDNAYESGTLSEYTSYYDPTWGRQKALTKPTPGNHEYVTPGAAGYFDYFGAAGRQPRGGVLRLRPGSLADLLAQLRDRARRRFDPGAVAPE
jgi:hypothetical protein